MLTITDPNDNPVTNISGLDYVTSGGVSGFDITTKSGLFNVAELYEITSTSSTEDTVQEWTFTVSFINLDTNQAENGGKTLEAEVILSSEPKYALASYITNNVYTEVDGENGLYYHDGVGTYTNADQEALDNSYRYSGANPNNYVCFGSDAASCSTENLYRIIGVFDGQVKLIKATSYGNYGWENDYVQGNQWDATIKPDIYTLLNTTYLDSLGSSWSGLIAIHSYEVGGGSFVYLRSSTAKSAYNYEVGANQTGYAELMKIGLMYVSDYYYGASPTYWTYPGFSSRGASYDYRAATDSNWLYLGDNEWTISRWANDSEVAYYVLSTGYVNNISVYASCAIRPSFYISSSALYSSGDGSIDNPYRIEI